MRDGMYFSIDVVEIAYSFWDIIVVILQIQIYKWIQLM